MTNLHQINIADIDNSLLADLDAPHDEFTAWEAPFEPATVDNQRYQIVHHAGARRGGIVFVSSSSSDYTSWTDAASPYEVLDRFLADEMAD